MAFQKYTPKIDTETQQVETAAKTTSQAQPTSGDSAPADFSSTQLQQQSQQQQPQQQQVATQPAGVAVNGNQQGPRQYVQQMNTPVQANPAPVPAKPVPVTPQQPQPYQEVKYGEGPLVDDRSPETKAREQLMDDIAGSDRLEKLDQGIDQALSKPTENYWAKYGNYNWSLNNGDFFKNAREANMSLADAVRYNEQYAKDNGKEPIDYYQLYALGKYDPTKSIKEQEEEDKKLKKQQMWEKIGNVFNHAANLYATVNGAPSAGYESAADLNKRQQDEIDRVNRLRSAASKPYLDALKSRQDAEVAEKQAAAKLAQQDRLYDLQAQKVELQRLRNQAQNDKDAATADKLKKQLDEIDAKIKGTNANTEFTNTKNKWYPYQMQTGRIAAEAAKEGANARSKDINSKTDYDEKTTTEEDLLGTHKVVKKEKVKRGSLKPKKGSSLRALRKKRQKK